MKSQRLREACNVVFSKMQGVFPIVTISILGNCNVICGLQFGELVTNEQNYTDSYLIIQIILNTVKINKRPRFQIIEPSVNHSID